MPGFEELSAQAISRLANTYKGADAQTRHRIASDLGYSPSYAERALRFWSFFEGKQLEAMEGIPPPSLMQLDGDSTTPHYPPSPTRLYDDFLRIDCDDAIVISDAELPDYDNVLMRAAHALGRRNGIKTLIIAGDFFGMDPLSAWDKVVTEWGDATLGQELRLGASVLTTALTWFDNIYAITGNHEHRLMRVLGGALNPYQMLNLPEGNRVRITASVYSYMYLNSRRGPIKITHPGRNYSRNPLTVPRKLLEVEPERCHMIVAHTHHCSQGRDPSGRWTLAESGCLRDPRRTRYKTMGDTTHPEWNPGVTMIRRGFIYSLPKFDTDWTMWLGATDACEVWGDGGGPEHEGIH